MQPDAIFFAIATHDLRGAPDKRSVIHTNEYHLCIDISQVHWYHKSNVFVVAFDIQTHDVNSMVQFWLSWAGVENLQKWCTLNHKTTKKRLTFNKDDKCCIMIKVARRNDPSKYKIVILCESKYPSIQWWISLIPYTLMNQSNYKQRMLDYIDHV
jgi:hypothetical protein